MFSHVSAKGITKPGRQAHQNARRFAHLDHTLHTFLGSQEQGIILDMSVGSMIQLLGWGRSLASRTTTPNASTNRVWFEVHAAST